MTVFSCDLSQHAIKHLQFLREIHHYNTATFRHDVVDDASKVLVVPFSTTREMECLRRYRDLWLPFVASTATTTTSNNTTEQQYPPQPRQLPLLLIPPPDVAWLWHCHRLAPQAYTAYCQSKYQGRILEASVQPFTFAKPPPPPPHDHHAAAARTEQLWKSKYPQEPFFLSHDDTRRRLPRMMKMVKMELIVASTI